MSSLASSAGPGGLVRPKPEDHKVCVQPGPDVVFTADPDQLEQMLINLVRNATDAVLELSLPRCRRSTPIRKLTSDFRVRDRSRSNSGCRWDVNDPGCKFADRRQWPGPYESGKCVHSVLHDKAQRKRRGTYCSRVRSRKHTVEGSEIASRIGTQRLPGESRIAAGAASTALML